MEEILFCPDAVPQLFGVFDFTVAPRLLFYAYVPAIAASLILAGYVLIKDRFSLSSRLLAGIALSFGLWAFNIFIQWVAAPVTAVMLAWELTALYEAAMFLFAVYFLQVFVTGRDTTFRNKLWLIAAALPVLILLPTRHNIVSFDLGFCEGTVGLLWLYVYLLEIAIVIWTLVYAAHRYVKETNWEKSLQIRHIAIGMVVFLGLFSASNILGEITQAYTINLVGPIGMVAFISFLTYLIVRFKAFNVKLLGVNALVWGLCILIASQFLFVETAANFILVGVTLLLAGAFGVVLVRSVRVEVQQRERLQMLSDQLLAANTQLTEVSHFKSQLLSLASHQIKAPLAAIKGYLTLVIEKGYGEVPEMLMKPLGAMKHSADGLVDLITSLLDLRKIDEGKMDYQFTHTDLKAIVNDVVTELQLLAHEKNLALNVTVPEQQVWVRADAPKLKQVIQNLVDNAIKYTPSGSVSVTLTAEGRYATCVVSDTGLGMAPNLLPRLFDEFTRDQRVQRTIRGTGLGLYIAKRIIEAHGGTVVASSKGEGEGSQFTVTMPLDLVA